MDGEGQNIPVHILDKAGEDGQPADLFLSHRSTNNDEALRLAERLEREQHPDGRPLRVWLGPARHRAWPEPPSHSLTSLDRYSVDQLENRRQRWMASITRSKTPWGRLPGLTEALRTVLVEKRRGYPCRPGMATSQSFPPRRTTIMAPRWIALATRLKPYHWLGSVTGSAAQFWE